LTSYKVGIVIHGKKELYFNAMRFTTKDKAIEYAKYLSSRLTTVEGYEIVKSDDLANT